MLRANLLRVLASLVRRLGRVLHDLGWNLRAEGADRENQITRLGQTVISVAHSIERRADRQHDRSWHR